MIKRTSNYMNKNISSNKGFTLVELIVVLVLMGIILSVTVFGALGWVDWVTFNKENDTAEDIFYAAQNQLTELDSSNAMKRKVQDFLWDAKTDNYINKGGDVDKPDEYYILAQQRENTVELGAFSAITDSNGQPYEWDKVWRNNPNIKKEKQTTIIRLMAKAGDYDEYLSNPDNVIKGTRLLFDLVAPYIADKSVLNGAIALEFSPEAGQVFAVCYTDKKDALTYSDTPSANEVSILDRRLATRESNMLGYFGVDTLTSKIKGRKKSNGGYRIEIENGESLTLTLRTNTVTPENIEGVDIAFTIQGAPRYNSEYSDVMSFVLSKDVISQLQNTSLQDAADNPVNVMVSFSDNVNGIYKGKSDIEVRLPVWKDQYGSICISLDAADLQAQSMTYAMAMEPLATGFDDLTEEEEKIQEAFRNTYSFYRFGFGENVRFIRAEADLTDGGDAKSGRKPDESNPEYKEYGDNDNDIHGEAVTFANYDEADKIKQSNPEYDYTICGISNGRHFYNIRFESDYSDYFKKKEIISADTKHDFILKDNIDWKVFTDGNFFLNSYPRSFSEGKVGINLNADAQHDNIVELSYKQNGENIIPGYDTEHYPFPGFRMLSYKDRFSQDMDMTPGENEVSGYYRISNINISFAGNCIYGVYGKGIKRRLEEHDRDSISYLGKAGALPLGLFAENYGEISNIELDNIIVSGIDTFGAYGSISAGNLFTSKVGGFVGENLGTVKNLYIDEYKEYDSNGSLIKKYSHVSGRSDIGGIVGHQYYVASDSNEPVEQTISGCINNAEVTGIGYVGGIIGRIYPSSKKPTDSETVKASKEYYDVIYTIDGSNA